jgi:SAM-dependent methyltransferase
MIKRLPPWSSVLDIGGGNGFVSRGIESAGFQTVLLEPGETGAKNARARGLKNIICSTFENANIRKNSISAASMFDVIEHIEDDRGFLASVHGALEECGRIYLSVPAYDFLWSQVDVDAGHFKRYSRKRMFSVLEDSGFKVEFSIYIFAVLPIPIFLFRSIPTLLGKRSSHREIAHTKRKEHTKNGFYLNKMLNWERTAINSGKRLPFGGTLLVTAQKV